MLYRKDKEFYQAKYLYFRGMCKTCTIVAAISSVVYLLTDVLAMGYFPKECILPRCLPLLPMVVYLFINKKTNKYSIIVPLSYLMLHIVMFCTCWALSYRTERIHANEGFLLMHIIFLALGLSAPFKYSVILHPLYLLDIVITDQFNHYESFTLMLVMNAPCIAAICIINYFMENVYLDHYQTKNKLDDMMQHDNLTRVYNRNILSQIYDEEKDTLTIYHSEIAILMIDVDFFKKINDTYGHEMGDAVLKRLAEILRENTRPTDYIIRWGGEEFIILLCGYSAEDARNKAEQIRKTVEADHGTQCNITVSIGGMMYGTDPFQETVAKVDAAMYDAKKNGRNRVIFEG